MIRRHRRMVAAGLSVLVLMASLAHTTPGTVLARSRVPIAQNNYNCGDDTSGGHCYAVNGWDDQIYQQPTIYGGQTHLFLQHLTTGDGHVSEETWITGAPPSGYSCPVNGLANTANCWVETGTAASGTSTGINGCGSQCVFWADLRPCQGCSNNYITHYITTPQAADYGAYMTMQVDHDATSHWNTTIALPGSNRYFVTNYSTNNLMQAHGMQIGAELSGSYGANMPGTIFIDNAWEDATGNYNFYAGDGDQESSANSVITSQWSVDPQNDPNGWGGTYAINTFP